MEPIRIVHFVSSIRSDSGVMAIIMNNYRSINRDNIQFDFLYFDEYDNTFENEINELGGKCYKLCRPNLSGYFFKELKNFFNRKEGVYSILHNHEVYMNFIISPIAKRNGVKNIIVHSHTTKFSDKGISAIRNRVLCLPIKRQADYYFACSIAAGEFLYGKKYVNQNRVFILNNAIDCSKFKYDNIKRIEVRKLLNLQNKLVIGHIGRFNEQKNHSFLIDIFNEILKIRKDAYLILVGDGPLEDKIKEKVKLLNLKNNVTFLGRRNDISDIMQAMDIFILPSLYEGLPLVGVEAQASGLQCFMADTITREVNMGNVRYLSLSDSIEKWVNTILEEYKDLKRRDMILDIRNKGFDINIEVNKLEEFYYKIIDKKRGI